jgi:hypothetical protein
MDAGGMTGDSGSEYGKSLSTDPRRQILGLSYKIADIRLTCLEMRMVRKLPRTLLLLGLYRLSHP